MSFRINQITENLAFQISSCESWALENFAKKGLINDVMPFAHKDYFYSYPNFGKTWKSGNLCQFHKLQIKCRNCDSEVLRNYAGIGTIYLQKTDNKRLNIICTKCEKSLRKKI